MPRAATSSSSTSTGETFYLADIAFENSTLPKGFALRPGMPVAHTLHVPSGDVQPIWEVAQRYRQAGDPVVLVAGERFNYQPAGAGGTRLGFELGAAATAARHIGRCPGFVYEDEAFGVEIEVRRSSWG